MIHKIFDSPVYSVLERGLDASSLRQKVISDNIANVSTPGFKRSEVTFEGELAKALQGANGKQIRGFITHEKHLPIGAPSFSEVKPKVEVQKDTSLRNDKNNVDIDIEMAQLAKNSIVYNALTRHISDKFSGLANVISGGRG